MYQLKTELEKLGKLGVYVAIKVRDPKDKDKKILAKMSGEFFPESDGFFASGEKPKAFAIVVTVWDSKEIVVAIPNGPKGEELLVLNPTQADPEIHVRLVSTYEVLGGRSTKPEDNSVTIISTEKGLLRVFSAGVVTRIQDDVALHFLVVQEMYRAKLYRDLPTQKVVVRKSEFEGYESWTALQQIVENMVGKEKLPLLKIPKKKAVASDDSPLKESEARVLFFDIRKGFGFARTNEGARYFHWKQSDTEDRLPHFEKDQLVSYSGLLETSRGVQLLGVRAV